MNTVITENITQNLTEGEINGKVEKKAGKRVGYNYIIVKSYKESQKNDVVKCLYIKSLTNLGLCVIKEGSYSDTKDKQGRNIINRLIWQRDLHERLQEKVRMPRLLGTFEERGNYYLVIEHIKGKALQKVIAENRKELRDSLIQGGKLGIKFLDYLIQIADILTILHSEHIVHRDATPNNYMITPRGKVSLIDMEMCYSLLQKFPTPAFQLGTYGYMSPQQEATQTPTTAEDVFALGAIILQMWSGVSPGKLTNESLQVLSKKIQFFIADKSIADLVTQCLLPEDSIRPSAVQIKQVLSKYKSDLSKRHQRINYTSTPFSKEEILNTIQEVISTFASPLLADEGKGWFADSMKPPPNSDKHKIFKTWYASFSHGDSGTIYMLSQAKRIGLNVTSVLPFVQIGLERVREKYIKRIEHAHAGLHFGSDGIAATLATSIQHGLVSADPEYLEWIDLLLGKETNRPGFISGVAGQGFANLLARPFIKSPKAQERLNQYKQFLLESQTKDGNWIHGYYREKLTNRKIPKITRGFAEGMSGSICFLLAFAKEFQNTESLEAAQKGLDWLIKKAINKKQSIQWLSSKHKELTHWWAEGTAGIALTFLKAFETTKNPDYKTIALKALESIPDTITDTNLSQGRGLSGLGEVYIEAFRILGANEWLHRANWIAQVIMQLKKQHSKHGPYWLVEHERQPVTNFMIGNSGVMHFLMRYCYPEEIGLPLSPS